MPPPSTTTTTETVKVVRPVKVIALICASIAFIMMLAAIVSEYWLIATDGNKDTFYRQGLWEECIDLDRTGSYGCQSISDVSNWETAFVKATAAFMIMALILDVGVVVLIVIGLMTKKLESKKMMYRIAAVIVFIAVVFGIIALSVFPAEFIQNINKRTDDVGGGVRKWYFAWSYGVAWGAFIFLFAAGILLLCDSEEEEVYYSEKTYTTS